MLNGYTIDYNYGGNYMDTKDLLIKAVEMKSSDLHIVTGVPATIRVNGRLTHIDESILHPEDTERFVKDIINRQQWEVLNKKGEVDFSYSIPGVQRFRVNAYRQRNTYSVAMRLVNTNIPTFEDLGLPNVIKTLANCNSGLVLVTGPTGSGKSTTLASMVDMINNTKDRHIITLEDPIEYLFRHNKSIIQQREIGVDSINFANALRACLRQDPDVILVGEMRDYDTISIALTAAETGHLVFSTLHTIGASNTVDRIIDVFPSHQQQQIRIQLAMTLQGVISQQLITKADGKGRAVAVEIMIANAAVSNMIREGKGHQLNSIIQSGGSLGMRTMDDSLNELYKQGKITGESALDYCTDIDYMKSILR